MVDPNALVVPDGVAPADFGHMSAGYGPWFLLLTVISLYWYTMISWLELFVYLCTYSLILTCIYILSDIWMYVLITCYMLTIQ